MYLVNSEFLYVIVLVCVRKGSVITQKVSSNDAFHLAQIPNLSPKSCLVFADLISPSPLLIRHSHICMYVCLYQTDTIVYTTYPTAPPTVTVLQVLLCVSSLVCLNIHLYSAVKSEIKCNLESCCSCNIYLKGWRSTFFMTFFLEQSSSEWGVHTHIHI